MNWLTLVDEFAVLFCLQIRLYFFFLLHASLQSKRNKNIHSTWEKRRLVVAFLCSTVRIFRPHNIITPQKKKSRDAKIKQSENLSACKFARLLKSGRILSRVTSESRHSRITPGHKITLPQNFWNVSFSRTPEKSPSWGVKLKWTVSECYVVTYYLKLG
jgi:hypothetical protein